MANNDLDTLVTALQSVEQCPEILSATPGESYHEEDLHPLVQEAIGHACGALIASDGGVNYANVRELRSRGYPVGPGEADSFGWLTGCITTKKGPIYYG